MEKFMITNLSEEKPRYTTVTYEKDDKKVVIKNFIGYKITIEKLKQSNCTENKLKRR